MNVLGWPNTRQGVPGEIDVNEFPSVVSVLEKAIDTYRDRPAVRQPGQGADLTATSTA
jgi:hypothetical protein